ncbi:MAG TPA: hypothetical protein VFC07_11645 [Verrucomicrobiae bacterium]|nr:hypothetical protein [Verrucomicrobiae bacterium]
MNKAEPNTLLSRMQGKEQAIQNAAKPLLEIMAANRIREAKITLHDTTCSIEMKSEDCEG